MCWYKLHEYDTEYFDIKSYIDVQINNCQVPIIASIIIYQAPAKIVVFISHFMVD